MKRLATILFCAMVALYAAAREGEKISPWFSPVRAFAEAAMVGALADWFAVTALFRRPWWVQFIRWVPFLGPLIYNHTAIVPSNKDRIGESLGNFVEKNFLTSEAVRTKLQSIDMAGIVAGRLSDPEKSAVLVDEICAFIPGMIGALDDDDIRRFVSSNMTHAIRSVEVAPSLGHFLEILTSNNKHQELFDRVLILVNNLFEEYREALQDRITDETPWFLLPFGVDFVVYDKIVTNLQSLLNEVTRNPDHELRVRFNRATEEFIRKLKSSPEYRERGELLKEEFLASPVIRQYFDRVWDDLKPRILDALARPDSALRTRMGEAVRAVGNGLLNDEAVRRKINERIQDAAVAVVDKHRAEISSLIAEQMRQWDAVTISDKIEREVGSDLQYIRINGTIIGGFIGLIIHVFSRVF